MPFRRAAQGLLAAIAAWGLIAPAAPEAADMQAAKKEGEVMWYSSLSLSVAQKVCKQFNDKKLGVTCILHRDGSGKLYQRYLQEAKGGVFKADVLHTSNIGHFVNLKKDHLRPYKFQGGEKFNPAFTTEDGAWNILRASVYVLAYNTKLVKPEDAPKTWTDLLKPRWNGLIAHAHPAYSGVITVGMLSLVKMHGWGYYDKMAALKPKIVQSAVAVIPLVARGEAHVVAGTAAYNTYGDIKKGEPIKMVLPKEGVAFISSPHAVLKKAPHPKAAEVFTDFLFSQEAQQLLVDSGLHVGHPGVKYPEGLPSLDGLKLIDSTPDEVKAKSKEIQEMFRKKFGD
ncbi:MAG: extracellular solute-binding protein [Candidatus Tectomicrobia bacterium]|nr:extracellular solute-binding protein [Candidatus Tectomicrobia bacterium]